MIGKILGGRYELLEKIGSGGMAIVYRAKCLLLNRTVAVKILRDDLDSSDEFLKRFNIEAQSAASLTNQHIVSIYDVGKDGNINYIVMECVEGQTLKEYIKTNAPIDWKESAKIAMGIADALSEAHKKHIIHRDIKPQNIIVTNDGDIKVTDFGIARVSSGATISVDGDVLGSVHYLSPEQARGGYVDERTDIYSLGVVLYEMLTGKVPFDGDTPVAVAMKQIEQPPVNPCNIIPEIPENISAIVLKAMSKEISGRYENVIEMYDDLNKVLSDPNSTIIEQKNKDDYLDEVTKKIPPIKIDTSITSVTAANDNESEKSDVSVTEKKKEKMSKSDKKTILSAVITSLIIVLVLSGFAASIIFDVNPLSIFSKSEEAKVPDLVGMTVEEAEKFLEGTKFTIVVGKSEDNTSVAPGTIIKHYPEAGLRVKGKNEIEVTIAKNGENVTLKSYENKKYTNAEKELQALGLVVRIERQNNKNIPIDYVISQYPKKGTTLTEGDTVTLYVSNGGKKDGVTVPDLSGMTEEEAKHKIEQENLVFGSVTKEKSSKEEGTVISQSPSADSVVDEKEVINIVISSGDKDASNDTGSSNISNGNISSQKKEKTLFVTLPDSKDEVTVKITADGSTIYEGIQKPKSNSDFAYTVSGSGKITYKIYIDGVVVNEKTINFDE